MWIENTIAMIISFIPIILSDSKEVEKTLIVTALSTANTGHNGAVSQLYAIRFFTEVTNIGEQILDTAD